MEGDAKMVTDALAGRCSPLSSIQMIIEGFRRWSLNAHAWQVTHVCRTGNFATHLMARNAKLVNDSIVWVEYCVGGGYSTHHRMSSDQRCIWFGISVLLIESLLNFCISKKEKGREKQLFRKKERILH